MADLKIAETSAHSALPGTQTRLICRVCQKQFSQYTCPRCNARYCSLQCYKKHSLRCTESFMRENVMEELSQVEPTENTKQKMLEILKRFHSENDENMLEESGNDEEDFALSEETIRKVLEGCDVAFEALSDKERKGFLSAVASGKLSHMFRPWEPWWLKPSATKVRLSMGGNKLVQSMETNENQTINQNYNAEDLADDVLDDVPAGPEGPLPSVQQLTKTEPSPLIAVHIVDVIYSYCFMLRFFNGDWRSVPMDAASVCLSMSAVLKDDALPETVSECLSRCLEVACSPAFKYAGGFSFGFALLDDVCSLLKLGRSALVCAFMDLHRVFEAAIKETKYQRSKKRDQIKMHSSAQSKTRKEDVKNYESQKILQFAKRKTFFLMCWINEQPNEVWTSLLAVVESEKVSYAASHSHSSSISESELENEDKQKRKISDCS